MSRMGGILEWAEICLGVNTQNFSSASNIEFSLPSVNQVPPRAGFTGEIAISSLPPRHNKQRDPPERSDICYMGPYQTFRQKTSPLDADFLSRTTSKLDVFALAVCASCKAIYQVKAVLKCVFIHCESSSLAPGASPICALIPFAEYSTVQSRAPNMLRCCLIFSCEAKVVGENNLPHAHFIL